MEQDCLIALGSNQPTIAGDPAATLHAALARLTGSDTDKGRKVQVKCSRFYRTPAFPPGAGPDFVNAAAMLSSPDAPGTILARLHEIEAAFGRSREARWSARTLDLDLLAIGEKVLPSPRIWQDWADLPPEEQASRAPSELILPHPRLQDRAFVLVPLAEIAPAWRHPVLGLTVSEMLARLPASALEGIAPL